MTAFTILLLTVLIEGCLYALHCMRQLSVEYGSQHI